MKRRTLILFALLFLAGCNGKFVDDDCARSLTDVCPSDSVTSLLQ